MKILSLITHFQHIDSWERSTIRIDKELQSWNHLNRIQKAWFTAKIASKYDCIVFFFDPFILVLYSGFYLLQHPKLKKPHTVFTTWLCDVSRFQKRSFTIMGFYDLLRWHFYRLFIKDCDKIVVHSSFERELYSKTFKVLPEKFEFIHYCVRHDALVDGRISEGGSKDEYVIAAGRHRDFATFIEAMKDSNHYGVIICGESDLNSLSKPIPGNIKVYTEIPFSQYRSLIRQAKALVIPLFKLKTLRSLGQVAAFEAIAQHVPVIASRSFQLQDYFSDKEIMYFEPEDFQELQNQIDLLYTEENLIKPLATRAYDLMMEKYTDQCYTDALLTICGTFAKE